MDRNDRWDRAPRFVTARTMPDELTASIVKFFDPPSIHVTVDDRLPEELRDRIVAHLVDHLVDFPIEPPLRPHECGLDPCPLLVEAQAVIQGLGR